MVKLKNILLIVLTVVTAYLLVNNIIHQKKEKSSNIEEIERISRINDKVLKQIDSLTVLMQKQNLAIDSIERSIINNQNQLENEIIKINKMRADFKNLPDNIRDRLLLDYIRANQ